MDKAVEELQQELKLLKNEIKETLTDVREVLLNTVENPFPQDYSGPSVSSHSSPPQAHPPAPPVPPAAQGEAFQQSPPQPPQQPMAPAAYPGGNGGPVVFGGMGGGGVPGMPFSNGMQGGNAGNVAPSSSSAPYRGDDAGGDSRDDMASGGPGLPPSQRGDGGRQEGREERTSSGPGLPPRPTESWSRRDSGREQERNSDRRQSKRRGASSRRGERSGLQRGARGKSHDEERFEDFDDEREEFDEDLYDESFGDDEDEDRYPHRRQPKAKVDLVALASLSPWLTEGIRRMGRKRVASLLDVYASMGGITPEMRDVLLQIVALDDTEGVVDNVSVQDTMRFLIELDDLMWRGRQDWRRAALMSMLGPVLNTRSE